MAAMKSNVDIRYENFEFSVVEIKKEDFITFLDELTEQS